MPEWDAYSIKIPHGALLSDRGTVLETVYHVVHLQTARRIIEDSKLRAGLIHDDSKLNRSRLSVTWLSANTWEKGSIYGSVQFSFPWSVLIKERQIYWVEAITDYSPPAYRFLITERDLQASPYVTPYDPSYDEGPLRLQNGIWYWNRDFTSEFMIESDIALAECNALDFVDHNKQYCRFNKNNCPDKMAPRIKIGAKLLSYLLGNNIHSIDHILRRPSTFDPNRQLSEVVDNVVNTIRIIIDNRCLFGGSIKSKSSSKAILRGALALYGADQKQYAINLLELLKSKEIFETALISVINEHFGISGWVFE